MKTLYYIYYKIFPKKHVSNKYKRQETYWKYEYRKDKNYIPDNNYTLW